MITPPEISWLAIAPDLALAIGAALALAVGGASVALAMQAAPERAVAGRASSWKQSIQENALAPKGSVDIAADHMRIKDGVMYWTGRPAIVLGADTARWRTTRSFVENVAAAIARAATDRRAAGRIYNVAEPEVPTEEAFVRELAAEAGWHGEIVVVPEEQFDRLPPALAFEGDARQDLVASSDRIRHELFGHERRAEHLVHVYDDGNRQRRQRVAAVERRICHVGRRQQQRISTAYRSRQALPRRCVGSSVLHRGRYAVAARGGPAEGGYDDVPQ